MLEITKIRLTVTEHFGAPIWKKFRDSYRFANERCNNPNSKDYDRYRGLWNFKDTVEYYETCFGAFLVGLELSNLDSLSIDRVDSRKPYEPGNVRFVTMKENLRNKDYVNQVLATNIHTGEVVKFPSFFSISKEKLDARFTTSGVWGAFKDHRLYKQEWSISILD